MPGSTPQQQLDSFIDKFTPQIASQLRVAMAKMLARLPGATMIVYDNYNALAIGFGPGERASDALFSLAAYPRWLSLFFVKNGAALSDPEHLLRGAGKVVRHIVLESAETLDRPAVKALMEQAMRLADRSIDPALTARLIVKSVSARQRPRRPRTES